MKRVKNSGGSNWFAIVPLLKGLSSTTSHAVRSILVCIVMATLFLTTSSGLNFVQAQANCAVAPNSVGGLIGDWWRQLGGPNSKLGCPLATTEGNAPKGGKFRLFQNGVIGWSPSTGPKSLQALWRDETDPKNHKVVFSWNDTSPLNYDYFIVRWDEDGQHDENGHIGGQVDIRGGSRTSGQFVLDGTNVYTAYSFVVEGCDGKTFGSDCKQGWSNALILPSWICTYSNGGFIDDFGGGIKVSYQFNTVLDRPRIIKDVLDQEWQAVAATARQELPKGLAGRTITKGSTIHDPTVVINPAGMLRAKLLPGGMCLNYFVKGNSAKFKVTTDTLLGRDFDPEFTVFFDLEFALHVSVPNSSQATVLAEGVAYPRNTRIIGTNVTGVMVQLFKGGDLIGGEKFINSQAVNDSFQKSFHELNGVLAAAQYAGKPLTVDINQRGLEFQIDSKPILMQPGAPVTGVWRSNKTHLDLFVTGKDGAVWSNWWEGQPGWQKWFPLAPEVKMRPGAAVTAVWRSNDTHLDLFATGTDGTVWSNFWDAKGGWQKWFPIAPDIKMQPGTAVTAVWRSNDTHLDLFATGADGTIWSNFWDAKGGWQKWFPIAPDIKLRAGATVAAVWRSNDTHLDLFATGNDGAIWSNWWEGQPGWQRWFQVMPDLKVIPGSPVTAKWRNNATHLDLFVIGGDGVVWSTWWEAKAGWQKWMPIAPDARMQPGAAVTAVWRSNDTHLDLFATGTDGTVWSNLWEAKVGWQRWFPIAPAVKMQPGTSVTALWRSNDTHLDLFATGTDGAVWSTWWESQPSWQNWFPISQ